MIPQCGRLNAENPVGTMQSIECALRGLDKAVADEQERTARAEKMLGDFHEQAGRPLVAERRNRWTQRDRPGLSADHDADAEDNKTGVSCALPAFPPKF